MSNLFEESYSEPEANTGIDASVVDEYDEDDEEITDRANQIRIEYGTNSRVVNRVKFEGKTVAQVFETNALYLGMEFNAARINYRTGGEVAMPSDQIVAGHIYTASIAHDSKGLSR